MRHNIVQLATGEVTPTKSDAQLARKARVIYDQARLDALEADSNTALGRHIMKRLHELDQTRKSFSNPDDPALNTMLGQIEMTVFEQVKAIQERRSPESPTNPWDFS